MATKPLRIIFAGTPDFAASSLNALLTSEHEVIAVYTQPDRPAGRGRKLTPSPVKQVAIEHNIPVYQPLNFKAVEDQEQLASLDADIMVVVAYGLLLPKVILETPRLGCINVHASLLPRWRGAAPIHRALLAGDTETGVTIMQMDIGLDTGDMLLKTHCPIQPTDTSGELHDRLALQGAEALIEGLAKISADDIQPEVQDDALACYASKLEKQEGQINWTQSATDIDRQIRGLAPWPVAFTQLDDKVLRIWRASTDMSRSGEAGSIIHADKKGIVVACGQGSIVLTEIQLPGKKSMDAASILNSRRELFSVGTQLG